MTRNKIIAVALPALLLAACNQNEPAPAESKSAEATAPAAATPTDSTAAASTPAADIAYECTPTMAVSVRYDNSDPKDPEAIVTLDGKRYDLDQVVSGSGARYFTDDGRAEKMTLTWWNKGSEGTLYEGSEGGDPVAKTLATCKEKA